MPWCPVRPGVVSTAIFRSAPFVGQGHEAGLVRIERASRSSSADEVGRHALVPGSRTSATRSNRLTRGRMDRASYIAEIRRRIGEQRLVPFEAVVLDGWSPVAG